MPTFVRDRLTWLTYAQLGTYGFFLYGFGPSVPLLGDDLGVSKAVAGLHGTALAVGAVLAGLTYAPLVARLGRAGLLRAALAGLAAGILVYSLSPVLPLTLTGALLAGLFGSYVVTGTILVLGARHGAAGPAAISEANAGAAGAGLVSPLLVGAGVSLGLGWRPGLLLAAAAAAVVWVLSVRAGRATSAGRSAGVGRAAPAGRSAGVGRAAPAGRSAAAGRAAPAGPVAAAGRAGPVGGGGDDPTAGATGGPVPPGSAAGPAAADAAAPGEVLVAEAEDLPGRLPAPYWIAWTVLVLCIGVEFCLTFWAAEGLREHTGAGPAAATAGVTAVVAGMFAGRLAGGRVALLIRPALLMLAAIGLALAGFAVFWLSTATVPALAGLAVAGAGVSLQYPVGAVRAVAASAGRPDRAAARVSLAAGLASGVAPFALGATADEVGTHSAFLLVPALLLLAAAGVLASSTDPRPQM